jgi:hypothetical protein
MPPLIPHPYFTGSKNPWWRPNNKVWRWFRSSNADNNSERKRKATGPKDGSMPTLESDSEPKPDFELSKWLSANNVLYAGNITCIAYSILSVELTLSWNQFDGVNTVDSVGQLIPLIIGIVSLAGLLYGFTVERSVIDSTDTLAEMLDPHVKQDDPNDEQAKSPSPRIRPISPLPVPLYDKKNVVLSTGNSSTEFWRRCPPRRFSIGAVQKQDILRDRRDYGEQQKLNRLRPWQRYSGIRHDRNKLEEFYESDVIEEYKLRDGTPIFFVKDFRKRRNRTSVKVRAWLESYLDKLSAFLGHDQPPMPSTSNEPPMPSTSNNPPMPSVISDASSERHSHGVSSDLQRVCRLHASSSNRSNILTCSRISGDSSREPSSCYYSDYTSESASSSSRSRTRSSARRNRPVGSETPREASLAPKKHPWLRGMFHCFYTVFMLFALLLLPPLGVFLACHAVSREHTWERAKTYCKMLQEYVEDAMGNIESPTISGTWNFKRVLPHRRQRKNSFKNAKSAMIAAWKAHSLRELIAALADYGENFLLSHQSPELAFVVRSFDNYVRDAITIRQSRMGDKIGGSVQHKQLVDLWHRLIRPGLSDLILHEIGKIMKDVEGKMWDPKPKERSYSLEIFDRPSQA